MPLPFPLPIPRGVDGGLLDPRKRELEISMTGSSRPMSGVAEASNGCLACMSNWLLMPNSMLTASSRVFSGVNVVFTSSFCISWSIMFRVNMSLRSSSYKLASWQCSACDLSVEWNGSIVSPQCCLRVSRRYLSNATFLGRMNVCSNSSHSFIVDLDSTFVWGNLLACIFRPSVPRLR